MHGSQPDAMVLCVDAGRTHLELLPHIEHRPLPLAIRVHEQLARVTNSKALVIGVSANTSSLERDEAARAYLDQITAQTGLPATDPIRFGCAQLADALKTIS